MKRNFSLFIKDILEAIADIESFIGDMSFEAFSSDRKTGASLSKEKHDAPQRPRPGRQK